MKTTSKLGLLTAYIIEDDVSNVAIVKGLLQTCFPSIRLLGSCGTVEVATVELRKYSPDIIFMDIELGDGFCFDILNEVKGWEFALIFITGFHEYAIKAIKFAAFDYLLKPLNPEEFKATTERAIEFTNKRVQQEQIQILSQFFLAKPEPVVKIALPSQGEFNFVNVCDILMLEASGSYTTFFLRNGRKYTVSRNLKEYDELLEDCSFCRVHHSWVVNIREVEKYVKENGGHLVMSDGSTVPVSTRKKEDFLSKYKS